MTNVGRWGDVLTSLNRLDKEIYSTIPQDVIAEVKEMTILELSEADPNLSMQVRRVCVWCVDFLKEFVRCHLPIRTTPSDSAMLACVATQI